MNALFPQEHPDVWAGLFVDQANGGNVVALFVGDTTLYEALARQAAATVAKARATADNAEKELKRVEALGGVASPSDRDKAASEAEQARAEVKAQEAAEAIARLNLERQEPARPQRV